ncbi:MAG: hypothetical protein A3H51_01135 [Candidatus Spechtbacteria bacterium RIFCSPLOWO2_02_FULL_38_8]|uniref:Four helix bundle protein n=1 Tax=Candidatus Spechtbacteria bacterium RIFCSPLOWO2_02_FULL_38_8 TaxID=1802164 RepID=A0A1G2HIV3_9BACT|nr:MAG: hypothetical protein A3H51_01135 [Candidatus Spechtbacteria bacterium RIFCSPLOWO2_02_FULL_38_8]
MKTEIKNFYDLEAWKQAHLLVIEVYKITENFPKEELYGIVSQLRRAVGSITANIAEAFARYHFKDKVKFYYQARGSAAEVQNFLLIARDLKIINDEICKKLGEKSKEVQKLINGLIRSIEKQK